MENENDRYSCREERYSDWPLCRIEEWRDEQQRLHRDDAPSVQVVDLSSGDVVMFKHHQHGKLHNSSGPAVMQREHGLVKFHWFENGVEHRDEAEGPAYLMGDYGGPAIIIERWISRGVEHRTNGPSYIERDDNGIVREEHWRQFGKLHRSDGAAIIERSSDGDVVEAQYYENGEHRSNAAAPSFPDPA